MQTSILRLWLICYNTRQSLKGEHPLRFINDRCSKLGFRRVIVELWTPLLQDVLPVISSHIETVVLMSRVNTPQWIITYNIRLFWGLSLNGTIKIGEASFYFGLGGVCRNISTDPARGIVKKWTPLWTIGFQISAGSKVNVKKWTHPLEDCFWEKARQTSTNGYGSAI